MRLFTPHCSLPLPPPSPGLCLTIFVKYKYYHFSSVSFITASLLSFLSLSCLFSNHSPVYSTILKKKKKSLITLLLNSVSVDPSYFLDNVKTLQLTRKTFSNSQHSPRSDLPFLSVLSFDAPSLPRMF